jgi:hypothetical protein
MKTINTIDTAFDYADKGWHVLPVRPRSKEPIGKLARFGHLSATTDRVVIADWFDAVPDMNVGISCEMSGLIVIDIDYRNLTKESWAFAKELYADTLIVETGDGVHLYFTAPRALSFPAKLGDGIDIKYKGYVVAPPSVHPTGKVYESNGLEPIDYPQHFVKGRI